MSIEQQSGTAEPAEKQADQMIRNGETEKGTRKVPQQVKDSIMRTFLGGSEQ